MIPSSSVVRPVRLLVHGGLASAVVVSAAPGCATEAPKAEPTECTPTTWYRDVDGDGFGDPAGAYEACEAPAGHVADATDCDDLESLVSPRGVEVCNGIDDDCSGEIDDGDGTATTAWYADTDGDGYGDPDDAVTTCTPPEGYVATSGDCNDDDPTVSPGSPDAPRDGEDQDCDGSDAVSLAEQAHVGDVSLQSLADVEAFCADHDGVVGDLQLAGTGLAGVVELDCLLEVTGDLVISTDAVPSVSLPALWWVGGELRVAGNPELGLLDVPSLRFVDGALVLLDNDFLGAPTFHVLESVGAMSRVEGGAFPALTEVEGDLALSDYMTLSALEQVGGGVSIRDGSLAHVSLPSLRSAGRIELRSVAVTTFVADQLDSVEALVLDLPELTIDLDFPALTTVADELRVHAGPSGFSADQLVSVGGDVELDPPDIAAISLDGLETVGGALALGGGALASLDAAALHTVDGPLWVECPDCSAVELGALQAVDGDLTLAVGEDLEALDLSALRSISGGLALEGAAGLSSLELPALASVGGAMVLAELAALESVDLSALVDPQAEVSLTRLPALVSVDLSSLQLGSIPGHVVVRDNARLDTLTLGPLGREAGSLTVEENPALTSLDLSGLSAIGGLYLSGPFEGLDLSSLASTTGDVRLSLDAQAALDLGALQTVGGDLFVGGPLSTLDLTALTLVGRSLSLNATELSALSLPLLEQVFTDASFELNAVSTVDLSSLEAVGGSLLLLRSTELSSLSLPALDSTGSLTLDALSTVDTLSVGALDTVTGNLEVLACDGLTTLDGLSTLVEVQGSLSVADNARLEDVAGLSGITTVGGDLRIQDNPSLPTAAAEALVYTDIGVSNVGGGVTITGNAP